MNVVFDSRPHRRAAAAIALLYVAIQTFQWYVFSKLPETDQPVASLMQGPRPLNLARAGTMLLSFFGLAYLFLVVCGIASRRRPGLAIPALLMRGRTQRRAANQNSSLRANWMSRGGFA